MIEENRRSEFAQEFERALEEFVRICREETRTTCAGQNFVLVDNVTKRLRQRSPTCPSTWENNLHRLGQTAYLRNSLEPPPMRKHHFEECLPVFYTLLDIGAPSYVHQFRDNGLSTLPISFEALRENIVVPTQLHDFHERFYRQQLLWCPILFEADMGRSYHPDVISPFLRKERIQPYRDGKGLRENSAALYVIEVPEEVVGSHLRKRMAGARIIRQGSHEKDLQDARYHFALKQFKRQKYDHFSNEKQMFANLRGTDGMVEYVGWFKSYELDSAGSQEAFWNIVLELADFDLYTAMRRESPPISSEEIAGFWDSLAEIANTLASIHTVCIDSHEYLTWHGDIKPENILRVNDRFKLADPGEASMLLKSPNMSGSTGIKHFGGTRSYAAPEKAAYWDGRSSEKPSVNQTCDVWSLGCVLSLAATYVVLGSQGVLIYDALRRQSNFLANEQMSDGFHDGKDLLPSVIDWHQYLREAARKTDPFTPEILDVVDNYMLVASGTRWNAQMVRDNFYQILVRVKALESQVPLRLLSLIQNIDLEAERHYDHNSGFTMVESDDRKKRPKSISIPSVQTDFESRAAFLNQNIQPTAQRSRKANGSPFQTPQQVFSIPSIANTVESGIYPAQEQMWTNLQMRETLSSSLSSQSPQMRISNVPLESAHRGMKVGQVKQMLKKTGLTYKPQVTSLSSLFKKQQTTIKGTTTGSEELEYLDQRLKEEFEGRDIVFLVDNGSTMSTWWTSATELLEVLVWRALGFDDEGMELYFTNPDTSPNAIIDSSKAKAVKKKVRKYTEAMAKAEPEGAGPKAWNTTILPELERIINNYARAKASRNQPRKKTIIVLTDGLWLGMHDEYTLDLYLRSAFHGLKDLHGDVTYIEAGHAYNRQDISTVRPITIQFVQFGDDPKASQRLSRLDDDMKSWACPDLIDTEDADGDIYKMFLGSLCEDIDRKMRHSLRLSPPTTINSTGVEGYINRPSYQHNSLTISSADSGSQVPSSSFVDLPENYSSSHHSQFANSPSPYHERLEMRKNDPRNPRDPGLTSLMRAPTIRMQHPTSGESWPPESMVSYPASLQSHAGPSAQSTQQYSSQYPYHRDIF